MHDPFFIDDDPAACSGFSQVGTAAASHAGGSALADQFAALCMLIHGTTQQRLAAQALVKFGAYMRPL